MARVYNRTEGVIDFTAGSYKVLPLSRNYHVLKYILRLELNVTNASSGLTYYDDNLFKIIKRLELIADGGLNIKQIPAEKLYYNSILELGRNPKTSITKTVGTFTQVQTVELNLIIPNQVRPTDTILWTKNYNTLNLEVSFGNADLLGTGITINSGKLTVDSQQLIGYSRAKEERINYYKEVAIIQNNLSDSTNYLVKLDVDRLYTGFLITAKNANVLTNDLIKNIRIKSGTVVFMEISAETIKRLNETDSKIIFIDNDINKGIYYLDFTVRNKLSDMLNTVTNNNGFNTLELELDIQGSSNTSEIMIYPEYIEITNSYEK
jgi:hypothetical protein